MTEENHSEQINDHTDDNAPAAEGVKKTGRGRRAASAAKTTAKTAAKTAAETAAEDAAPPAKGKTGAAGKKTGRSTTAKSADKNAFPDTSPGDAPETGKKTEGAAADRETPARSSRGGRRTSATRKTAAVRAETPAPVPEAGDAATAEAPAPAPEAGAAPAAHAPAGSAGRGKTASGGRKSTSGRRSAVSRTKAPEGGEETSALPGSVPAGEGDMRDAAAQARTALSASVGAPPEAAEKKSRGRSRGTGRTAAKNGVADTGREPEPLLAAPDALRKDALSMPLTADTALDAGSVEQDAGKGMAVGKPADTAAAGSGAAHAGSDAPRAESDVLFAKGDAPLVKSDTPSAENDTPFAARSAALRDRTLTVAAEDPAASGAGLSDSGASALSAIAFEFDGSSSSASPVSSLRHDLDEDVAIPADEAMLEVALFLSGEAMEPATALPLPTPEAVWESARQDAAADDDLSDFPSTFGDSGPEDFFGLLDELDAADLADAVDAAGVEDGEAVPVSAEKRRRGRSRRGRGKKRATAQAAADQDAVAAQSQESAADQEAVAAKPRTKALETGAGQARSADDEDDAFPLSDALAVFDDTDDFLEDEDFADEDEDAADEGRGRAAAEPRATGKAARRKMFVSVLPEEQVEVVITEEGQVQEYYVEMLHQAKTKGNIYKGVVHNVDPNLQAAFVSYGAVKNGFLQIDEVHPEYYVAPHDAVKGRKYPPIQKVLKSGQELLVQVVKEPAGTKGAFLTTYLSLPGRFLVLTPGREQIGVSRKVENETERARLREMLEGLSPGPGLGVIVRTVSMGASKTSLQRDLQFLQRTWKEVRTRGTTEKAPCLVYQEVDLTSRAVRDYLTENIGEVWIDDEPTAVAVSEIAEALFPRKHNLVRAHKETTSSLFERFNIQRQLDQIHSREVSLPSGGRLVIDPTEALTAIDINSGRSSGKSNFEDMAYRTNMEAAKMIPLQLRLRDIGGQVVADFIEMRDKSHWREVEKTLRNGMKVDRARYDVGKIGPFGMLEIVRQRLGSSAISISTEPCPCCNGTGVRRNMEWRSQHALRDILRLIRNAQAQNEPAVVYNADQSLALHLLNLKRQRLLEMEQQYGVRLDIHIRPQEIA